MTECMETCQKYENSRVPELRTLDDMHRVLHVIADSVYLPGTTSLFPKAKSGTVWMSITHKTEMKHIAEPEAEPEPGAEPEPEHDHSEHEHEHEHEQEGEWVDWYTKEYITPELYNGISGKLGKVQFQVHVILHLRIFCGFISNFVKSQGHISSINIKLALVF